VSASRQSGRRLAVESSDRYSAPAFHPLVQRIAFHRRDARQTIQICSSLALQS
jgi:hypothetical protein